MKVDIKNIYKLLGASGYDLYIFVVLLKYIYLINKKLITMSYITKNSFLISNQQHYYKLSKHVLVHHNM